MHLFFSQQKVILKDENCQYGTSHDYVFVQAPISCYTYGGL